MDGWAAREAWAVDHPVTVPCGPATVDVPPIWQWPEQALLAILAEDYEAWAALALTRASYATWTRIDPTLDEVDDLLDAWEYATAQPLDDVTRMWHAVDRHRGELESDLIRWCHGQDLRHLWEPGHGTSRLTWRRLAVLYDGLPPESLTKTAQTNALGEAELARLAKGDRPGFAPFSHTDMLIAELIDAVNSVTYVLRLANVDPKKRQQVKPAEPVHRPGLVRKRRPRVGAASPIARRVLAYMREHNGALPEGWRNSDTPV